MHQSVKFSFSAAIIAIVLFSFGCRKPAEPPTVDKKENRNAGFSLDAGTQPAGYNAWYDEVTVWSDRSETSEQKTAHGTISWSLPASVPEIVLDQAQFDGIAKIAATPVANGISAGSNRKSLEWTAIVENIAAEFTARPVFAWSETANTVDNAADQGTAKVKVNSVSVKAACGSFSLTHSATVTFKYTPPVVTLTGVEVKSVNWGQPVIDIVLAAPRNLWEPGAYVKATYTGSAVFTLKYSDGSTKESTMTNFKASTTAKFEDYIPHGTPPYIERIIQSTPVQPTVVSQTTNNGLYTETVRFIMAEGEFYIEYSIANSIVTATVEGVQVPVPFGNGILEMTKLEKVFVSSTYQNSKWYRVDNIYPTILFTHPAGGLQQEFPRHYIQVAEPW